MKTVSLSVLGGALAFSVVFAVTDQLKRIALKTADYVGGGIRRAVIDGDDVDRERRTVGKIKNLLD